MCGVVAALAPGSTAASGASLAPGSTAAAGASVSRPPGSTAAAGASVSRDAIRVGVAPQLSVASRVLGAVARATPIRIAVALKPRDPAALAAFASAVSTPGSDLYRDYLSVGQFARRFGPTVAQVDSVKSSLRAHGLQPGAVSANRLTIPVSATADQLERAFSLSFVRVALASGKVALANTAAPLLDAKVAGLVQAVVGLDSLATPQPLDVHPTAARAHAERASATPHVVTGGPQPCATASAAAPSQSAYTADQIASAYGYSGLYGAGDEGAGQTIALYELEPDSPADIAAYQACYGTSTPVSYVNVDAGAGSGDGSGEAALDIEDVIGLAPRASVIVYQGPNSNSDAPGSGPYDTYNAIFSQDKAKVVSTSWGACEPSEGSSDAHAESTLFQEAAAQGQSIFSAAGDSGSEDCNGSTLPNFALNVDDPASQPFVTGVGGTTMPAIGPPPTEKVWNDGGGVPGLTGVGPGASGGGVSTLWKMPSYQAGAAASVHVTNANSSGAPCDATSGDCREVPDVSADADPDTGYLIYYNGDGSQFGAPQGWQGIGGSSASAPTWAALMLLTNASRACRGSLIGFANPALYRIAGSDYKTAFNDITTGNNDYTGTHGGEYGAGVGYDMATGLGTPVGSSLAADLCSGVLRLANPGAKGSKVGAAVRLRLSGGDYPGGDPRYSATGLPAGLSIAPATGVISGTPKRAGSSTVAVVATDASGQTVRIVFTWTIRFATLVSSQRPVAHCTGRRGSKTRRCTYAAPARQVVHTTNGHRARIDAYLLTNTGVPLRRASVTLTDGKRKLTRRTNRAGRASFTLAAGRNRSVSLAYAGGASDYASRIKLSVRNA